MTLLGIVAPALLLVFAVRRWIAPLPWKIALLFLALTLAFLGGAVFSSKLPVPVDEVARGYPWRGIFGEVATRNPSTNDTVKLFLPWMQVAREELLHFRAPLWNRYSFSGYPLLGNGESAPFSPLFLATLIVPLPKQIVAMAGLKILAALLFTYLFMRREGAGDAAAIFAAVAFAFSTVMTVFLYYSAASVIAFLPAAAFALVHEKRNVVLIALVIATLMANGHPESVLHIAVGCGVLLAIDLARAVDRHAWLYELAFAVAGVALGLALSAPAWVPVLEQVRASARLAKLQHVVIPHAAAWGIVAPNGFGNPVRHDYSWFINYPTVAISFPGLLTLALFVAGAMRQRLLAVATVVLYLFAMDWSVVGHAANAVPPFSLAANDKLRFVCIFFACVIAAKAIDEAKWKIAVAALPVVALLVYVDCRSPLMRPIDLFGIAAIALFLALPRRWATVAIAAELFVLNVPFNALVNAKYFRPPLPIVEALRAHAPAEPFRVVGHDWAFLPNASAQYGVEDIRGSDPMASAAYDAFLRRFTVQEPGTWVRRVVDVDRPELDFLNVRFLLAEPDAAFERKWRLLYRGPDGTLFENLQAKPRFSGARDIRALGPAAFAMRVRGPAEVVSSQPGGRGWRVEVGGREEEVHTVEGAFIGFRVPAGEWAVRVWYQSLSYRVSLIVAFLALTILIFWNMRWGWPVVRRPDTETPVL